MVWTLSLSANRGARRQGRLISAMAVGVIACCQAPFESISDRGAEGKKIDVQSLVMLACFPRGDHYWPSKSQANGKIYLQFLRPRLQDAAYMHSLLNRNCCSPSAQLQQLPPKPLRHRHRSPACVTVMIPFANFNQSKSNILHPAVYEKTIAPSRSGSLCRPA